MNLLSLEHLRTYVAIVEHGGYAKAGDQLGRSQPAISLQIKKLEQQLNCKLFKKEGQRHIPSGEGVVLFEQAKKMLAMNEQIIKQFDQPTVKGRIRLGIPSEFAAILLPSILGEFGKLYPDISLEVTSSLSRDLIKDIGQNRFDLILALYNPDQALAGQVVMTDQLVWVGNYHQTIDPQLLSLVLAPDGCIYRSRVIDKLKQQTVQWRIIYTNADLSGITVAISQGLGITAMARCSVPESLNIIQHAVLPDLGQVKICLLRSQSEHPQATDKLAQFLTQKLNHTPSMR